jgi:hypothetical protein
MAAAQEICQPAWTEKNPGGPSDFVQRTVVQRCSLICTTARIFKLRLLAGVGQAATLQIMPKCSVKLSTQM